MLKRIFAFCALFIASVLTVQLSAQDFNIDMRGYYNSPDSTYQAAGQSGFWNMAPGGNTSTPPQMLYDVNHNPTAATLRYPLSFLGTTNYYINGPATGNDEALLEDGFLTTDIPERIRIDNLINGNYQVIACGIFTNNPSGRTAINIGGTGFVPVGGTWNGVFTVGVTHALANLQVTNGTIDVDWVTGTAEGIGFLTGIQIDLDPPTAIGSNTEIPSSLFLYQNYPNPFNPSTKIKFDIPGNSFVTLNIFDMLGREVQLLVSENLTAGSYTVDFNGSSLTCGVYYCKLESNGKSDVKKMMLVK